MAKKRETIDMDSLNLENYFEIVNSSILNRKKPEKSRRFDMEDVVSSLLNSTPGEPSKEILEKCSQLLTQQRMLEDTRARRRLEKWATRVIGWYLIIVCLLVLLNGFYIYIVEKPLITDKVMIAILTTTTVNIIGLGLIVLRGHFHTSEHSIS